MTVKTNLQAINCNRMLGITGKINAGSTEKVTSGYKINRAADNAAGLSISEKMRKQIRGLDRASDNAEEGISLIQTAEGALGEIHEMLQRMNELAVQAANGTNSETDRSYIQNEIDQIKEEIDRVSSATKFNEIYLLDGHLADPAKVGKTREDFNKYIEEKGRDLDEYYASNDNKNEYSLDDIKAMKGLKIIYTEVVDEINANPTPLGGATASSIGGIPMQKLKDILQKEIVPNAVKALVDNMPGTFAYLRDSDIGIGLNLYTDSSNTLASVAMRSSVSGSVGALDTTLEYKLSVNINSLHLNPDGSIPAAERTELEKTIVHEMMHGLMDEALTAGMSGWTGTSFNDSDRFAKWFIEGMAQAVAGPGNWVQYGLGLNNTSAPAAIQAAVTTGNYNLTSGQTESMYATGYLACMYLGSLAGSGTDAASVSRGIDDILTRIKNGDSLNKVIADVSGNKYTSAADFATKFGDTDSVNFISILLPLIQGGAGAVVNKDYSQNDLLPDSNTNEGLTLFQLNPDIDNVKNSYPSPYIGMSGGNMNSNGIKEPSSATPAAWKGAGSTPVTPTPTPIPTIGAVGAPIAANIKLNELSLHIGADSDRNNKLVVYIEGMSTSQICVDQVDVRSEENATRSIDVIAFGIEQVSRQRSALGAYQNRLEHTIKNLDNVVENTTAAESQIRDTDMASEIVQMTNSSVLMQAGQSMLAQSNQSNQGVLSLIA